MAAERRLTLLAPALFGPLPGLTEALAATPGEQLPGLEALRLLATRGRHGSGRDLEPELLAAVGREPDSGIAPLTWLAEQGTPPDGYCLRADPVHLLPGQHNLLLAGAGEELALDRTAAEDFVASLNALYGDRGWRFEAPRPDRWYLHLPRPPSLQTTPLPDVLGMPVDHHLPGGDEGREWNAILTEIQMALHGHPRNAERVEQGRAMINSVWFWGGGTMAATGSTGTPPVLWADGPVARGLALHDGVECRIAPEDGAAWLRAAETGEHVVAVESGRYTPRESPGAWLAHLEYMEEAWLRPLLEALRRREVRHLRLVARAGTIELTPRRLHRFWERPRSLARLMAGPGDRDH
ncbi:MAG: hypothetical protein ACQERR_01525 [Pseudomonadota bacterium]